MENDLSLEDGDNNVIIREDVREQLDTAQEIREAFSADRTAWARSLPWKLCRFPATNGAAC